ncbi:MAG: efflux RND transporter permease subunit [Gemmatimonadales bacterium]
MLRHRWPVLSTAGHERSRGRFDDVRNLLVNTRSRSLVPLASLASVRRALGPNTINRESVSRRIVVQSNVEGRDVGSFVREIKERAEERWGERTTRRTAPAEPS